MFDFFSENVPKLSPKFSNDVELVSVDMEKRICVEVIYETCFSFSSSVEESEMSCGKKNKLFKFASLKRKSADML